VAATTRNHNREQLLCSGVDQIIIDRGSIAEAVKEKMAGGVHKVLGYF
jgi:hypothetical protein